MYIILIVIIVYPICILALSEAYQISKQNMNVF